jgi:hypothetical protein
MHVCITPQGRQPGRPCSHSESKPTAAGRGKDEGVKVQVALYVCVHHTPGQATWQALQMLTLRYVTCSTQQGVETPSGANKRLMMQQQGYDALDIATANIQVYK